VGISTQAGILPFAVTPWSGNDRDLGVDGNAPDALRAMLVWAEWEWFDQDGNELDDGPEEYDPRTFNGWSFYPEEIDTVNGLYLTPMPPSRPTTRPPSGPS
jgi:hypothetical protein